MLKSFLSLPNFSSDRYSPWIQPLTQYILTTKNAKEQVLNIFDCRLGGLRGEVTSSFAVPALGPS
jgi:hypothetical protein